MSNDEGRPVKPHRSGGGHWVEPFPLPLPNGELTSDKNGELLDTIEQAQAATPTVEEIDAIKRARPAVPSPSFAVSPQVPRGDAERLISAVEAIQKSYTSRDKFDVMELWADLDAAKMALRSAVSHTATPGLGDPPFNLPISEARIAHIVGERFDQASEEYRKCRKAVWACLNELSKALPSAIPLKDDVPLRCELVNGSIEFNVGQKVLAHATNICPAHYDAENDRGRYRVTDHEAFAQEVVRALNHESEDGRTMLSQMMDAAVAQAIDEGAEGVEENR